MSETGRLPFPAAGETRIGEVAIKSGVDGYILCHRDDVSRCDLSDYIVEEAVEIAKFDDDENYRPLKTAPNLRHDWRIVATDLERVSEAIDSIYPGRVAVLNAWKSGRLVATPLRETLNRQSGLYRVAAKISDAQIDDLVANFCRSHGGCLRTILWKRDKSSESASTKLPAEKFDPEYDQTGRREPSIPLLCQEACNLLVAEARRVVKNDHGPTLSES